jgi:hypothetical protein
MNTGGSIPDELEKLDRLRVQGVLSDAEFAREKMKLLTPPFNPTTSPPSAMANSSFPPDFPVYRQPLAMVLLTLICPPAVLFLIWTGPVYRYARWGSAEPVLLTTGWKIGLSIGATFLSLKWLAFIFG